MRGLPNRLIYHPFIIVADLNHITLLISQGLNETASVRFKDCIAVLIQSDIRKDCIDLIGSGNDGLAALSKSHPHGHYILNTPNDARSGIGAFRHAANASPSTSRVWAGSMMPSSHSRAVACQGLPCAS